jgi:hypothetical protein
MTETDWNLLSLYMSGEANEEQELQVLRWRNATLENSTVFEDARRIFCYNNMSAPFFDSKPAFQKLSITLNKKL